MLSIDRRGDVTVVRLQHARSMPWTWTCSGRCPTLSPTLLAHSSSREPGDRLAPASTCAASSRKRPATPPHSSRLFAMRCSPPSTTLPPRSLRSTATRSPPAACSPWLATPESWPPARSGSRTYPGRAFPAALQIARHALGAAASRVILRGDAVQPADAVRLGVADQIVPGDELLDRAVTIAAAMTVAKGTPTPSSKPCTSPSCLPRRAASTTTIPNERRPAARPRHPGRPGPPPWPEPPPPWQAPRR